MDFIYNNTRCHMSVEAICIFPMNHTGIPSLSQEETVHYPHRYYFWITIIRSAKQVWYPPTDSHTPIFKAPRRNVLLLNKTKGTDFNTLGKLLMLNRIESSKIFILIWSYFPFVFVRIFLCLTNFHLCALRTKLIICTCWVVISNL